MQFDGYTYSLMTINQKLSQQSGPNSRSFTVHESGLNLFLEAALIRRSTPAFQQCFFNISSSVF